MQILFLGHESEHHNSAVYLPKLASYVSKTGIYFTYTTDPDDLNPEYLDYFDAIMIYSNHEHIEPDQEAALLNFVEQGRGLMAIHAASYSFLNSPSYTELVGARLESHGMETFTADIIDKDHPAVKGVNEFETRDETYVHHKHNEENRTVLMTRDGEPYTWVREQGNGRIFYTALGHDERTWDHPEFLKMLKTGTIWAVGEDAKERWSLLAMPEFSYSESDSIPNYEQRDPPPELQAPFTPEESMRHMQVPPGFRLELFASEPDIVNPIAINWDQKGRLWVIESIDYPNQLYPDQRGNDRIRILEDTNGDGRADTFTVFQDSLNIPTSLTFANGGILVAHAPNFIFLKDTTGNDKADIQEVVMDGWGSVDPDDPRRHNRDTHAGPSNFRYGFDNKIWGTVGYRRYHPPGEDEASIGNSIYRFNPDGSGLTFIAQFSNNTWGLGFTETFDIFGSTANNEHSVYVGIPLPYVQEFEELRGRDSQKIDGHYSIRPITENIRQVDVHGGFTSAAGHSIYTARNYPENYWNRIAFINEPTGHLLHRAILEKHGAGFREKDGWNMLASPDEWVSPVQADVGPDGAVWVVDWYNFIIQHSPVPEGFERGVGNAHINPLRDSERGRIYRIVYEDAEPYQPIELSKDQPEKLLQALQHENLFWRLHAQRLLVERGQNDITGPLHELIRNQDADAIGLNPGALHALWTLHGLGKLTEENEESLLAAFDALNHTSAGVRKAAVQVLPEIPASADAILNSGILDDQDPHTQLAAILKTSDMPVSNDIARKLTELNQREEVLNDPWLKDALYIALSRQKKQLEQIVEIDVQAEQDIEETAVRDVRQITISAPPGEMAFDIEEFEAEAGENITIILENPDFMPHNLLIVKPGTLQAVGDAADRMMTEPDAADRHYVPDSNDVLFYTPIINPGETYELTFTAPDEPGEYPYVCTFPGHWRTMQGVMIIH